MTWPAPNFWFRSRFSRHRADRSFCAATVPSHQRLLRHAYRLRAVQRQVDDGDRRRCGTAACGCPLGAECRQPRDWPAVELLPGPVRVIGPGHVGVGAHQGPLRVAV